MKVLVIYHFFIQKFVFFYQKILLRSRRSENTSPIHRILKIAKFFQHSLGEELREHKGCSMKIIVQAGGLGTRMKSLTSSKPKALIPVFNKPILFHLFDLFGSPSTEFIVIGDYKYEVLDDYLITFAKDKRYILMKAKGKGNAAGIKEALRLVPDNEAVMLIWSDLILPKDFKVDTSILGCQVGVADFPCSWCVVDNKLVHENSDKNGVVGLYVFDNKSMLKTLPSEGSFTTWLSQPEIVRVF